MIKREHIKQAIDAIAARDPEAGYGLDALLGSGRIDLALPHQAVTPGGDFVFLFENRPVTVKRFVFFNQGSVAVERGLLIKYGEMVAKSTLEEQGPSRDYKAAALQTRIAGLDFLVRHEIDGVLSSLKPADQTAGDAFNAGPLQNRNGHQKRIAFLNTLQYAASTVEMPALMPGPPCYKSRLRGNVPVAFGRFVYSADTLRQVADINLEFFHVRFLLKCLAAGLEKRLYAATVGPHIVGLLFLDFKQTLFTKRIEIVYVATAAGGGESSRWPYKTVLKGVGSVLMAGAWLLWKTQYPHYKEIFLDAEVGARRFYDRMGFRSRGLTEFVMGPPRPYLLAHIVRMLAEVDELPLDLNRTIRKLIHRYAAALRTRRRLSAEKQRYRRSVLELIDVCLRTGGRHNFAAAAVRSLQRCQGKDADINGLMNLAAVYHNDKIVHYRTAASVILPVVIDACYGGHLENLFHLETPKRVQTLNAVLREPLFRNRWEAIAPRPATVEELCWIHTRPYVETVAESAGRPLTVFDMDTQASAKSYETACLAVGGVFRLLDLIWQGETPRGFACVRPPGHHAEAGRAMGFCLFNNVALGACYLRERYAAERVMVVDLDAHHGNGIQNAFYQTDRVLYLSAHLFPGYPGSGNLGEVGAGRGEGFNVNIPMVKGSGDNEYARVLHFLLRPIAMAYQPEVILVALGFDLFRHDRLGQMACSPEGYAVLTAMLIEVAETVCSGKIAFVLEGGYSIQGIRECGRRVFAELCGIGAGVEDKLSRISFANPDKHALLKKVAQIHHKYWDLPF